MDKNYSYDVFLSHSTKDKQITDMVCAALEARKIRCWVAPRDIIPGSEWGESIIDAINHSKIMVLIFSSNSNISKQVSREVESAVRKGVHIIPFRIENINPTGSMEYYLFTQHWLDALSPPLEKHINTLVNNVEYYLRYDEAAFEDAKSDSTVQSTPVSTPASTPVSTPVSTPASTPVIAPPVKPRTLNLRLILPGIVLIIAASVLITVLLLGGRNHDGPTDLAGNLQTGDALENEDTDTQAAGNNQPESSGQPESSATPENSEPSGEGNNSLFNPKPTNDPPQASGSDSSSTPAATPSATPKAPSSTPKAAPESTPAPTSQSTPEPTSQSTPEPTPAPTQKVPDKVTFNDGKLEAVIRGAIGKSSGDVMITDLTSVTELHAASKGIVSIDALKYLTNLEYLSIEDNSITDLSPLKSLTKLREAYVYGNQISSLEPLRNLKTLTKLYMCWNKFTNVSPLSGLTNLKELSFGGCGVSDITPLANLTSMEILRIYDNNIKDLTPLKGMTQLYELFINGNPITDYSPIEKLNIQNLIK